MMAAIFYQSITQALGDNKVVGPADFVAGLAPCDKFAGSSIDAGGYTQRGSGYSDGIYYHDSKGIGVRSLLLSMTYFFSSFTSILFLWTCHLRKFC
jgi:hypothetical protein